MYPLFRAPDQTRRYPARMDWLKIASALFLLAMVAMMWRPAKHWLANSPKADSRTWMTALIPIGIVGLFVMLLVALV